MFLYCCQKQQFCRIVDFSDTIASSIVNIGSSRCQALVLKGKRRKKNEHAPSLLRITGISLMSCRFDGFATVGILTRMTICLIGKKFLFWKIHAYSAFGTVVKKRAPQMLNWINQMELSVRVFSPQAMWHVWMFISNAFFIGTVFSERKALNFLVWLWREKSKFDL